MATDIEMKQACLDLSKAATALFDIIEAGGIDSPMEGLDNILILKDLNQASVNIIGYYQRRNIQRMLALGVSPETLLKMARDNA